MGFGEFQALSMDWQDFGNSESFAGISGVFGNSKPFSGMSGILGILSPLQELEGVWEFPTLSG